MPDPSTELISVPLNASRVDQMEGWTHSLWLRRLLVKRKARFSTIEKYYYIMPFARCWIFTTLLVTKMLKLEGASRI